MLIIYLMVLSECLILTDTSDSNKINYYKSKNLSDRNGIPTNKAVSYLPIQYFNDTTKYIYKDQQGQEWELYYTGNRQDSLINTTHGYFKVETDSSWVKRISKTLYKGDEPLLYNYYLEKNIYRFTWIRSFHNPVIFTIINDINDNPVLSTKIVKDEVFVKKKEIKPSQWKGLSQMLDQLSFWSLPIYEQKQLVNDGSSWTLETHNRDGYYVVSRWSPENSPLRKLGEYIIQLSSLEDEEIY